MESWIIVLVHFVAWNPNLREVAARKECGDDLPLGGSANARLLLNCTSSYFVATLVSNTTYESDIYTYSVAVTCTDVNRTLTNYTLLTNAFLDYPKYISSAVFHNLSPGSECVLYGCYTEMDQFSFSSTSYALPPEKCSINVDECLMNTHNCSDDGFCRNTNTGYNCSCKDGFAGDGVNCTDINECLWKDCGSNSFCNNTKGSHFCSCKSGYAWNGSDCIDWNECNMTFSNTCSPNAHCENLPGSYRCVCTTGYTGDGHHCYSDVYSDGDEMAGFSSNLLPVWLVPTALLLCLVVLALSIALIIFYRKRTKAWLPATLFHGQQKVNKEHNPLNGYSSEISVVSSIESLYRYHTKLDDNSELWEEESQDQCVQDTSLSSDEVGKAMEGSDANKHKECVVDVWRWKNSAVNDVGVEKQHIMDHNDSTHSSDSAECDMTDSIDLLQSPNTKHSCPQKIHLSRSNTTKSLPCTNTDTSNHNESGFLSDTSSYVYYFDVKGKH